MADTAIRAAIAAKLSYAAPYYGRLGDVVRTETDFDTFPYTRFFRGVYNSPEPAVYSRRAGYRVLENAEYACAQAPRDTYVPDLCFSAPSSTTYPCYPPYFYQYASEVARNNALNRHRVNTAT